MDFSNLLFASWLRDLKIYGLPELLFFSAILKCSAVLPAPGVFCFFVLLAAVQRYSLLPLNSIGIILAERFISANYNYRNGMNSFSACWGADPSPDEHSFSNCGCAILTNRVMPKLDTGRKQLCPILQQNINFLWFHLLVILWQQSWHTQKRRAKCGDKPAGNQIPCCGNFYPGMLKMPVNASFEGLLHLQAKMI